MDSGKLWAREVTVLTHRFGRPGLHCSCVARKSVQVRLGFLFLPRVCGDGCKEPCTPPSSLLDDHLPRSSSSGPSQSHLLTLCRSLDQAPLWTRKHKATPLLFTTLLGSKLQSRTGGEKKLSRPIFRDVYVFALYSVNRMSHIHMCSDNQPFLNS